MPRMNLWKSGTKTNDYRYTDKIISEYFKVSGTTAFIYKYIGISDGNASDVTKIQDFLLLENRDLKYDTNIFELPVIYQVQEDEPDLRQFSIFYGLEGINLIFHYNDSVDLLSRKMMVGDIIELPHLRDNDLLDGKSYNKFYKVNRIAKPVDGYSATWYSHLLSAKCTPLHDQQESYDLMSREAYDGYRLLGDESLRELMSNDDTLSKINNEVVDEANKHVPHTNFETSHFYIVEGSDEGKEFPWIFAGDGIPPNGAVLLGKGETFPDNAKLGTYYLRTDMSPPVLHKKTLGGKWKRIEIDYRRSADIFHRLIESFVFNNNKLKLDSGKVVNEKQALSKIGKKKETK